METSSLPAAPIMLSLRTHAGQEIPYRKPQAKATFNETKGDGISWAAWSWNPVTGCLHGCDYCYARAIAARFPDAYPAGFTPLFHHERLDAPANTKIPAKYRGESHRPCGCGDCKVCAYRRVFVCSMADLSGGVTIFSCSFPQVNRHFLTPVRARQMSRSCSVSRSSGGRRE